MYISVQIKYEYIGLLKFNWKKILAVSWEKQDLLPRINKVKQK